MNTHYIFTSFPEEIDQDFKVTAKNFFMYSSMAVFSTSDAKRNKSFSIIIIIKEKIIMS